MEAGNNAVIGKPVSHPSYDLIAVYRNGAKEMIQNEENIYPLC